MTTLRRIPASLAALLVAGAVLGATWALLLPPLQGPDEAAHVAAVARLVDRGELVGGTPGLPADLLVLAEQGGLGALVGNPAARPLWSAADRARTDRALDELGDRSGELVTPRFGPPTRGTARNPPLYSFWASPAYVVGKAFGVREQLTLMRLWNIPLLLVSIAACWLLAAELLPGRRLAPIGAGGIAALQPQWVFQSSVVNPDVLLVALCTTFSLLAVRLVRRGNDRRRTAALLGVAVAAALTHGRGAALLPVAAIVLLLTVPWSTLDPGRRRRLGGGLTVATLVAAGVAVLVGRTVGWDGAQTAGAGRPFDVREFVSYVWQFYLPPLGFMDAPVGGEHGIRQVGLDTAWGTFASLEVRFTPGTYDLIGWLLLGLGLLTVAAAARARPWAAGWWRAPLVLVVMLVATLATLHVAAYRTLLLDPSDPIIVGRHLLVLLGPFAALAAFALTGGAPRVAAPAVTMALTGLLVLDLAGLGLSLARFYG